MSGRKFLHVLLLPSKVTRTRIEECIHIFDIFFYQDVIEVAVGLVLRLATLLLYLTSLLGGGGGQIVCFFEESSVATDHLGDGHCPSLHLVLLLHHFFECLKTL